MKRITALMLALVMVLCLCACNNGGENENSNFSASAKNLIAATLQSAGYEGLDILMDRNDEEFAERFHYYYGIETDQVKDFAIANCSETKSDEISVLVAAEGVDVKVLTDALESRCTMQRSSYELYSPEDVEKLDNALVFAEGNYAVLIVADDANAVGDAMKNLFDASESIDALAQQYIDGFGKIEDTFDYSQPVPDSEAKDRSWFEDAVFIGDSRMVGLVSYSKIKYGDNFSREGLNVADMFTKDYIETDAGKKTVADALQSGKEYGKCYMMTGVNELGWKSVDTFADYYGDIIDHIKSTHPETQIYIMSILPVGEKATAEHDYLNNERVQEFNAAIKEMCTEKQVYYVNVFDAVAVDGALPNFASPDGVHMDADYCNLIIDYLLKHTV